MLNLKYYQALNRAIHDEMVADESVVLLGEDVGESGGIFGQTKGLFDSFGSLRVRDTPIAENGFVSTAIGAAMTGLRPVVEIGFEDFLTACMDPLVNQAAKLRYMMGGQVNIPMVVYTFGGGGLNAGPQHSQSFAPWFAQVPGLKAVMPSTPLDTYCMTRAAIQDNNPVLVLLSKKLIGTSQQISQDDLLQTMALDTAECVSKGEDITILAFGTTVSTALRAQKALQETDISAEIIDGRSINPLDIDAVYESVKKTGHLLTLHEAHLPCGMGAEVIAGIVERDGRVLKKPPIRLGPVYSPSPFAPELEKAYLPTVDSVVKAVTDVVA